LLEYISILRIKNILNENFDTDPLNDLEAELYNIQNIVLRIFVRNIVDHIYYHLINGLPYIKNQYSILQKYMDLRTHAQICEAAKELHIMKFNTVESTISAFNSFYNTITDAELIIIQELLLYTFLTILTPYFEPGLATIPKASIRYRYWIVLVRYYKDRYVSIRNRFLHRFLFRTLLFLLPLTFPSSYDDFIQIIYLKYFLYLN
jgi:hypothetical protein